MTTENYDLVIIGTGSGNSVISAEMDDWRIAIVERWTFGGTCLNRGCIPSKMLVYAADVAESAAHDNGAAVRRHHALRLGRLAGDRRSACSPGSTRSSTAVASIATACPTSPCTRATPKFVGERTIDVDGKRITRRADRDRCRSPLVHPGDPRDR